MILLQIETDCYGRIFITAPDSDRTEPICTVHVGADDDESVTREQVIAAAREAWKEVYGN